LEAVEHSVWDIPDYTASWWNNNTYSTQSGHSAYGEDFDMLADYEGRTNVGSLKYLSGLDMYGNPVSDRESNRPWNHTDGKYYNENWSESWKEQWGAAEGTAGQQDSDGDNFYQTPNQLADGTLAYKYASRKHVLHTHGDPDKNNTYKVQGEIKQSGTGISGSGTGGNMVPYVVLNSIIRYA